MFDSHALLEPRKQLQSVLEGNRQLLGKHGKHSRNDTKHANIPSTEMFKMRARNQLSGDALDTTALADAIATCYESSTTAVDNEFEWQLNELLREHGLRITITPTRRPSMKREQARNGGRRDHEPATKKRAREWISSALVDADHDDTDAEAEESSTETGFELQDVSLPASKPSRNDDASQDDNGSMT
nr:hypothetical protein CFP56_28626 [Quercus suber]